MKCVRCGSLTKNNKIVCPNCQSTDFYLKYLKGFVCKSFQQVDGAPKGYCKNFLLCKPIKSALKGELLLEHTGHVVCPYPSINLSRIIYGEFSKEELKINYKKYFNDEEGDIEE